MQKLHIWIFLLSVIYKKYAYVVPIDGMGTIGAFKKWSVIGEWMSNIIS